MAELDNKQNDLPDVIKSALGKIQEPSKEPLPDRIAQAVQPAKPSSKLDLSKYTVALDDPNTNKTNWDKRVNGSDKGMGFLGLLKNAHGTVSSELSIGVEIDGKEVEMPTLVPTLNQQEVDWLMANPNFQSHELPKSIHDKAVQHAMMRMQQGLSPFAD